jgi:hypothetical protein
MVICRMVREELRLGGGVVLCNLCVCVCIVVGDVVIVHKKAKAGSKEGFVS